MTAPSDGRDDDSVEVGGSAADGGAPAGTDGAETSLSVPEMDCPSCASKVESALSSVEGVQAHDARPATGDVEVAYDPAVVDQRTVADAVESAGYEVVGRDDEPAAAEPRPVWRSPRARTTAVAAVFLAAGLLVEWVVPSVDVLVATVRGVAFLLADVLYLAAAATGGQVILRAGYYSARNRSLDIDFLMSTAIVSAVGVSLVTGQSLYSEAATLAVLFNVAELLEEYSMDQARSSLRDLLELAPAEATVVRAASAPGDPLVGDPSSDVAEVTVPADEVAVGERVVVRPGEKVPLDGSVVEGSTAVDESPVTGESVPADKAPGDEVYAGTINEGGYVEVEVTAAADDSTLSRLIGLVEAAQSRETSHEQFVDRFARYYTPVMVALAVLVATVPPLLIDGSLALDVAGYSYGVGGGWATWFVAGITMLVLACPCAFVISTPVSVVSGITSAARNGVLVKGGDHLEAMGEVDVVAMDKTGTLTRGELAVTDVVPVNGHTEDDVLRCARGLETRSEHPIAEAIVDHAATAVADPSAPGDRTVEEFESLTGEGVRATLDGTPHVAGKPGLFRQLGFDLSHVHAVAADGAVADEVRDVCEREGCLDLVQDTIPRLQREGKTVVLVGTETEVEGVVAVADEIRPEARRVVERLHDLGVRTVMLTGDNERTARAVAADVGIGSVRAELLPEEKVAAVEDLLADGGVAMVGDGINDAPALATATVGVAMGAAGTDAAIETADVALLGDDLSKLPYLRELAQRANAVIRQNIWASLGVKAVLAVGVPLQLVGVAVAVLVGDAGMTVGVTSNAMRLAGISPEE
jgi:Cd2+/Zn2+-exporting ATPase